MTGKTLAFGLRALALLVALATVPGCAVNPATGEQAFTLMSPGQEAEVGRGEHDKLVKQFGEMQKLMKQLSGRGGGGRRGLPAGFMGRR